MEVQIQCAQCKLCMTMRNTTPIKLQHVVRRALAAGWRTISHRWHCERCIRQAI